MLDFFLSVFFTWSSTATQRIRCEGKARKRLSLITSDINFIASYAHPHGTAWHTGYKRLFHFWWTMCFQVCPYMYAEVMRSHHSVKVRSHRMRCIAVRCGAARFRRNMPQDVAPVWTDLKKHFCWRCWRCCNAQRLLSFCCRYLNLKTIPYDTVYLRALKSWRNGQLNLAHGTGTKILKN